MNDHVIIHSAKGSHWTKRNHKYIRKEGDRYIYADVKDTKGIDDTKVVSRGYETSAIYSGRKKIFSTMEYGNDVYVDKNDITLKKALSFVQYNKKYKDKYSSPGNSQQYYNRGYRFYENKRGIYRQMPAAELLAVGARNSAINAGKKFVDAIKSLFKKKSLISNKKENINNSNTKKINAFSGLNNQRK